MPSLSRYLPATLTVALLLGLPAGSAWAGPAQTPGVDAAALLRLIGGLLLVIVVIVGLSWSLRRVGGFSHTAAGQLKALASLSIGGRERIVLVQVGKQQLLLGVAPGRVQTLHVLEEPLGDAGTGGGAPNGAFAQRLRGLMQQDEKR